MGSTSLAISNFDKYKSKPVEQTQLILYDHVMRDLKNAIPFLTTHWGKQNDRNDKSTDRIVYGADTFDDLNYLFNRNPRGNYNYSVHRWFNKRSSKTVENIFCSYNIVKKEKDEKHPTIDFYIMDTPFDLKVSNFPKKFGKQREDYSTDRGFRNDLIKWLYDNQSQGRRCHKENEHTENRLFIVCKHKKGLATKENSMLKMDFKQIHSKVDSYLHYCEKRLLKGLFPFNRVRLNNGDVVCSEIIFIQ